LPYRCIALFLGWTFGNDAEGLVLNVGLAHTGILAGASANTSEEPS